MTKKALDLVVNQNLHLEPSKCDFGDMPQTMSYYSNIDGSYFSMESMIKDKSKLLFNFGVFDELQNAHNVTDHTINIGLNKEEQKWYGWSHRAIFGFGIGSTCKKGNVGYKPSTVDELFDSVTGADDDGWAWQNKEDVTKLDGKIRIRVEMTSCSAASIVDKCDSVVDASGADLSPEKAADDFFEIEVGRGEWTAKTMEDAKQMAIDFADDIG